MGILCSKGYTEKIKKSDLVLDSIKKLDLLWRNELAEQNIARMKQKSDIYDRENCWYVYAKEDKDKPVDTWAVSNDAHNQVQFTLNAGLVVKSGRVDHYSGKPDILLADCRRKIFASCLKNDPEDQSNSKAANALIDHYGLETQWFMTKDEFEAFKDNYAEDPENAKFPDMDKFEDEDNFFTETLK